MDLTNEPFFPSTLEGAADLQRRLAGMVRTEDAFPPLQVIGGADLSYSREEKLLFAAVVTFDACRKTVLETATFVGPVTVPYVPGFLSFREGPGVLAALSRLSRLPDLLFCDGHGLAHPRRFGLACHLGVSLDLPTLGAAKSLLVGTYRDPQPDRGSASLLVHRNETIGLVLRTRDRVKPVFVSIGHRISLDTAARLVLEWSRRFRIPEPLRLAHREVSRLRQSPESEWKSGQQR